MNAKVAETHPNLNPNAAPAANAASGAGNAEDIEEKANSYFQKIYTSEQSIDEVIQMLKRFKNSQQQREQEIFACMIHNLFDEYRFFHKYPEKELRITGILFGTLIQHQLCEHHAGHRTAPCAAVLKPPATGNNGGKMFRFGMFALQSGHVWVSGRNTILMSSPSRISARST